MHSKKQGNGLIVVLIILTAIAFGVYSISDLVTSESRLNKKNEVYVEAKQAVESLLQDSMADLQTRFQYSGGFSDDLLSPERNPLTVRENFLDFHNNDNNQSNLVIPTVTRYNSVGDFFTQDTEVIGGNILFDSETFSWAVEVFAKATVDHPALGSTTVFASQIFQVRTDNLWSYAIFYNMPMEIAPGSKMSVADKVHVNGDLYVQSSKGLDFKGKVTLSGDIYHGRREEAFGGNIDKVKDGAVNFTDAAKDLINMKVDGSWLDSKAENFADLARQIWNGNFYDDTYGLLTREHGVDNLDLPGLSEYIEDTNPATDAKEAFNSGYTIIQPALDESDLPSKDTDPDGYEKARRAEDNKFAYKAGLTVQVQEDGSVNYFTYERDAYNKVDYEDSEDDRSPKKIYLTPTADFAIKEPFERQNDTITGGLFDKRQEKEMNLINIDLAALIDLLEEEEGDEEGGDEEGGGNKWGSGSARRPQEWWNGVVYVEFPQQNQNSERADGVNPAKLKNWAVKLVNGERIPNPSFAHDDDIYGTTIATNQQMYIEGNYNSDGNLGTGSATESDNDDYGELGEEAPAGLAADAITFLSESWDDAKSDQPLDQRAATPTEVSAAILTGIVPSGKDGSPNYSGGAENLPRFLEKWRTADNKKVEFMMRGSIVAMFESEVANAPWGKSDVYKHPERTWGFHNGFNTPGKGPRGGPFVPTYVARDLRILTEAEYRERIQANWPGAGAPPAPDTP